MPDPQKLHAEALVWDAHACLPLHPDADITPLVRHKEAGTDFISVNVGMDMNPLEQILPVLASFKRKIAAHPDMTVVGSVAEIEAAKQNGLLAVAFDLEGSVMLHGRTEMVYLFQELGVRQMHLAYNRNNDVGGGCLDDDIALTPYGRDVVRAVNDAGIILDGSHMGRQTTLDMMAVTQKPFVFSHANPKAPGGHPRCITDEQIDACAATGGVIGIVGVNFFLGAEDADIDHFVPHMEYVAERVGIDHVGIGIDVCYDQEGLDDRPANYDHTYWWPKLRDYQKPSYPICFTDPTTLPRLTDLLVRRGWTEADIRKVLGENFKRVALATWTS